MANVFNKYIWLVDTINRARQITFEEINKKWLKTDWSEGQPIPLRTFHNHRAKIEEIFDINIDCNGYNQYFIATPMDNGLRNWLLDSFSVMNLIHESHSLKDRILFEKVPSGELFLTTIIEAMRDEVAVKFHYKPFWHEEIPDIEIEPYCVKIFKQRWYVLGKNTSLNEMRIYGLDRIQSITTTNTKFKIPKTFKADAYFENAFGIVVSPKVTPCEVKIKVFGNRQNYLQTLPLHHSQREVESNKEYTVFKYYIAPTQDFIKEILSFGSGIEVLSPESFRNEIAEKINKMNNLYKR
ncbi:MAG: WYL domain-containing protein [Flavobacteriaceae bacterium]